MSDASQHDANMLQLVQTYFQAIEDLRTNLKAELNVKQSPRRRYVHSLALIAGCLRQLDVDADVFLDIQRLAVALNDLEGGIVDALFDVDEDVKKIGKDPTRKWQGRMWVALGYECLTKIPLTHRQAKAEVSKFPKLHNLKRSKDHDLGGSAASWHNQFMYDEVSNSSALKSFKMLYRVLGLGTPGLTAEAYREQARAHLLHAVKFAE